MKKDKYIKKFFWAEPYDVKAIEEFLEQKAAEGLMLAKFRGRFYYFEKCEPKKVRFQIDYFKKATIFDTNPHRETRKYIDFCEECGWTYLQGEGKMQFFYTEDETIPPLQTDSKVMFGNIIKNTLIFTCVQWIFLPFTQLLNLGTTLSRLLYGGPYEVASLFADGGDLWYMSTFIIYILLSVFMNVRFVGFILRNRKQVKSGEELQFYSWRNVIKTRNIVVAALVLMIFALVGMLLSLGRIGLYMVGLCQVVIIAFLAISKFSYHKKANRTSNIVLNVVGSIVLCGFMISTGLMLVFGLLSNTEMVEDGTIYISSNDPVPVTLEMLGVKKEDYTYQYEDKAIEKSGTPLAHQICYNHCLISEVEEELPYYYLEIFESRFEWINNKYREAWFKEKEYEITRLGEEAEKAWVADAVYLIKGEYVQRMMIIKGNKTVLIEGDYPDTQKAKVELSQLYQ